LLKDEVKVDVVVVLPAFGNEVREFFKCCDFLQVGYYIAHKKNASLVTCLPVPASMPPLK